MIRRWNRMLWGANALLALGIVAFVGKVLVAPPKVDWGTGMDRSAAAPSPPRPASETPSEDALIRLPNPIRTPLRANAPPFDAILKGALPASQAANGTAFIRSKAGPSETIARMGEPILRNGKPAAEFAGWLLSDLGKDYAVFTNRRGERFALEIESPPGSEESLDHRPHLGEAYRPEKYRSRRLVLTDSREVWGIDEDELDWAAQNSRLLLDRDVQISFGNGGLRLDALSPDSMPSARGLKPGDILREVNGRPLSSLADLRTTLSNPPRTGLQLTLERAGKPFVIEYRPLPR